MKIFPFPELVTTDLPAPKTHRYGCDRCDFQSIYKVYVASHKEIQHQYGIFSCNQCDFQANYQIHVRDHKMYKHNDIKYKCKHCNYEANCPSDLFNHCTVNSHLAEDEDEHADEFGIEEAINQRGNDLNQSGDTGKEKYGSLSMDKDLDNPMKKLHDLLKHIGEFDVCVKCEFETKFLYIVSKQGHSVDISDREESLDNDESDNSKEYVDDQGNEYENKEPCQIPEKVYELNTPIYQKYYEINQFKQDTKENLVSITMYEQKNPQGDRHLLNFTEQISKSVITYDKTDDTNKREKSNTKFISVHIVHITPIT